MTATPVSIPTWARRALLGLFAGARDRAALPDAVRVVEQAPQTLEQVERIDGNVQKVVLPVVAATEDLTALQARLDSLGADLAALQELGPPVQR